MRHLNEVRVLQSENPHGFHLTVAGFYINTVLAAVQRSGAVIASSGGSDGDDPIVIHAITSGEMTFGGTREEHPVKAGQLIVRDSRTPWRIVCGVHTSSHVITIPRRLATAASSSSNPFRTAHLFDMARPEVRLIFDYLTMLRTADMLDSPVASEMAEKSFLSLLAGLLEHDSPSGRIGREDAVLVARSVIEQNLESKDLTPAFVAGKLGISVRALHRAFSASECSVMSLIRQLRMEKARSDLLSSDPATCVSLTAAKWHFSDASHFIRSFKQTYGLTPKSFVQEHATIKRAQADEP
ncbi:helix-turn-helix domain-containing protein [Streptomyces sp. CA-142005]|uniref:helix-turn-helix domain-containing protein n=1 Tax=Streptomyces sp. CA-142005 TaxID=3240052 RepID=UPI003D8D63BB